MSFCNYEKNYNQKGYGRCTESNEPSHIKENVCLCKNKGNCKADQRLCFRYMDSTISLLLKSEISSL